MAPDVQPAAHAPEQSPVHPVVAEVTARVVERSRASRTAYLQRISRAASELSLRPARTDLGCSNLAHAVAACGGSDRTTMAADTGVSLGIVTSYNDMLSAHAPFEHYPAAMKQAAREVGAVARVAGGVPHLHHQRRRQPRAGRGGLTVPRHDPDARRGARRRRSHEGHRGAYQSIH